MTTAPSKITKVLSFDFGLAYIGVAIGQSLTNTASPLAYIKAKKGIPDWKLISALIKEWKPTHLIIGNPMHMDGSDGTLLPNVIAFQKKIETLFDGPIELHDERLSSVEAKYFTDDPLKTHSISATIIAESWLSSQLSSD